MRDTCKITKLRAKILAEPGRIAGASDDEVNGKGSGKTKEEIMKGTKKGFRWLYSNGGRARMAKARRRAVSIANSPEFWWGSCGE